MMKKKKKRRNKSAAEGNRRKEMHLLNQQCSVDQSEKLVGVNKVKREWAKRVLKGFVCDALTDYRQGKSREDEGEMADRSLRHREQGNLRRICAQST
jgi:hypothetical protein